MVTTITDNVTDDDLPDILTQQFDFHRALSKLLSSVISSHLAFLSSNNDMLHKSNGSSFETMKNFFQLLLQILHHPSGRILSEQINMWTSFYRDPKICQSKLVQPFLSELMTCFMDQMVRIRWHEDVEEGRHMHARLLEASFEEEDEYETWMMDLRSRASLLFKFIGNTDPQTSAQVLSARVKTILAKHGDGAPMDFLDPKSQQLTAKSEAVIQIEALFQPLENTMGGIPSWAMMTADNPDPNQSRNHNRKDGNDQSRESVRHATRSALLQLTGALVNWQPTHVYLKFRHAALLETLRHFWEYEPTSLLQGVDTLIRYVGLPDEWKDPRIDVGSTVSAEKLSGEMTALKKKSGVALVSISKQVPHHLVPWLSQLSQATKTLLSSEGLIPLNQMHLYEFLSCVATAVKNTLERSNFIGDVLSEAVATLQSTDIQSSTQSCSSLLNAFGVTQAAENAEFVTDPVNVAKISAFYSKLFIPLNRLLSVGRRCNEAARKRSVIGGLSIENISTDCDFGSPRQPAFPADEGPISIHDLANVDPFAPLWLRFLPSLLQIYEVTLAVWRPEIQAVLLQDRYQRYAYAISDDEAYLAKTQTNKSSGGVFGEGGTAGSVVSGTDRRDRNLVPKWSGWFNELRNTCFQLFGLLAGGRTLYAPELASLYPRIVAVLVDPLNLRSMEHRHFTQFMKHVVEILLTSCPCSLYKTHLEPILGPIMDHIRYRLLRTWQPVLSPSVSNGLLTIPTKALCTADCAAVSQIYAQGEDLWFSWYYAHAGVFVGDLDQITAEAAVEKYRVDLSRTFSDVLQTALALKGDWALVLANLAKEEQASKKNDSSILTAGPRNRIGNEGTDLNADGTPRVAHQTATDARKMLRINALCHFLLLESESIAGNLTLGVIQCLGYPDAYTCRRIVKICHRILETVAWTPQYSQLLGQQMFTEAVKNLVTEPKWMVGIEWDMINVVRDIYCRLVLGQTLQAGGQGAAQQQPNAQTSNLYEQARSVDSPLQGGGILVIPSEYPRQVLAALPGIGSEGVRQFENDMLAKRSSKDQKDCIRDLLRVASDTFDELNPAATASSAATSIFDRAVAEESLLHEKTRTVVQDLPEKLVTHSQLKKASMKSNQEQPEGLVSFSL
jgi:exportin-5